jgi:hypothetical protein
MVKSPQGEETKWYFKEKYANKKDKLDQVLMR